MQKLRRRLLAAIAAGAVAGPVVGQPEGVHATVVYETGAEIPKGVIALELGPDAPAARVDSDGKSKSVAVSLPSALLGEGAEIVAYLERADGWLLARGSAIMEPGTPVQVTLYPVIY